MRASGLILPKTAAGNRHVYHLYVVRHPARDAIGRALADRGIAAGIHYPWPIHTMHGYAHLGYAEGALPETERAAREILSLPLYPSMSDADQDLFCDALREVVTEARS